jgi:hypothetical protein
MPHPTPTSSAVRTLESAFGFDQAASIARTNQSSRRL